MTPGTNKVTKTMAAERSKQNKQLIEEMLSMLDDPNVPDAAKATIRKRLDKVSKLLKSKESSKED